MTNHEIAAFIAARAPEPRYAGTPRYTLPPGPGTELHDEARRGCPDCGTGHEIQACPAIRKRLFEKAT